MSQFRLTTSCCQRPFCTGKRLSVTAGEQTKRSHQRLPRSGSLGEGKRTIDLHGDLARIRDGKLGVRHQSLDSLFVRRVRVVLLVARDPVGDLKRVDGVSVRERGNR